jgi:hypothetical protein
MTATLKVSADNPGDTIASHNTAPLINLTTFVRPIGSSYWFLSLIGLFGLFR